MDDCGDQFTGMYLQNYYMYIVHTPYIMYVNIALR
jgi:hypothetical protein